MAASNSQRSTRNFGLKNSLLLTNTDQFDCGICMNIMYNASSCVPCLHSFCAGCVGEWLKSHKSCPMCRAPASDLLPNRNMNELIEKFVAQNPECQRSDEDITRLDTCELEYLKAELKQTIETLDQFFGRTEAFILDLMRSLARKCERINKRLSQLQNEKEGYFIITIEFGTGSIISSHYSFSGQYKYDTTFTLSQLERLQESSPSDELAVVIARLTNFTPDVPVFIPADSVLTDPAPIAPVRTDPAPIAPVLTDPAHIAPVLTDPAPIAPVLTDPAPIAPLLTDPAPIAPLLTDPAPIAPVLTDPAPISPVLTDLSASFNDSENQWPENPRNNRRRRPISEVDEEEVAPRRSTRLGD